MQKTSQLFKALSDDTRLRIMGLLLNGELCVCEVMAILELPQSTVSRHLAYLKNSGLVSDRRRGIWMHYQLSAGESNIHKDLIELLREDIAEIPQVRDDQENLREFLSKKKAVSCCE